MILIHLGGLGITNPAAPSDLFDQSQRLTAPITDLIVQQDEELGDALEIQQHTKSLIRSDRKKQQKIAATNLKSLLPTNLKRVSELASERGASNWLTVLPLKDHGFNLHKGAFRDALCLRYGWSLSNLPTKCPCGANFSVEHAQTCATGGFTIIRHNEIRDVLGSLLTGTCHDVAIEPTLQPLTGENLSLLSANRDEYARLDVAASAWYLGGQI